MRKSEYISVSKIEIDVALEPVTVFLTSLNSLNVIDQLAGMDPWLIETASQLTDEERNENQILLLHFIEPLMPDDPSVSVDQFLAKLPNDDPERYRSHWVEQIWSLRSKEIDAMTEQILALQNPDEILEDPALCIELYRILDEQFDVTFEDAQLERLVSLLKSPAELLNALCQHLNTMWEDYFAPEWHEIEAKITHSVQAIGQLGLGQLSANDAIRKVVGRELVNSPLSEIKSLERLIFVPSPHLGSWVFPLERDGELRLVCQAQFEPDSDPAQTSPETLQNLNALADEVRLAILAIVVAKHEVTAQELIEQLNQSQPTISRHLTQLCAAGFLQEHRGNRGKKFYALNHERAAEFLQTLQGLFKLP